MKANISKDCSREKTESNNSQLTPYCLSFQTDDIATSKHAGHTHVHRVSDTACCGVPMTVKKELLGQIYYNARAQYEIV